MMAYRFDPYGVAHLKCENKALKSRLEKFESGQIYTTLSRRIASIDKRYESKFRKAKDKHSKEVKKLNCKIDALEKKTGSLQDKNYQLKDQIKELKDENKELTEAMKRVEEENQKLIIQLNKDFENSSIPSSAQGLKRKKIPNTRINTGKLPGGQKGHKHHPRKIPPCTNTVILEDLPEFIDNPDLYKTDKVITKYIIEAHIDVNVTKYCANIWRSKTSKTRYHSPFPSGVKDDINYDGSIKALIFMLTHECCVSAAKTKQFLCEASGGKLNISEGMIKQLSREFCYKSDLEKKSLYNSLQKTSVMHADFTGANVDGKGAQVLILANNNDTLMLAKKHKGHKGIANTPLEDYAGYVIHDHDKTFYSYGSRHQECMQHNIRYLIGSTENEPQLTWNRKMLSLCREMIHAKNTGNLKDEKRVEEYKHKYDEIIELGKQEYKEHPPNNYYKDGFNLLKRLDEYKESELTFLDNPNIDCDNSRCERYARVFKRKQHQAMVFRSFDYLENTCMSLSIIDSLRRNNDDVFEKMSEIFNRDKSTVERSSG